MQDPLRESSRKRNEQESNGTLSGGRTQLYRSRIAYYRRNHSVHQRRNHCIRHQTLFPSDEEAADRWFKCKLYFITLDEKSGAEKKTATNVLVQAADLRDAVKKLDEGMKGTMADYVIASVAETALMDVYPYSAEPDVKPEFPDADKR